MKKGLIILLAIFAFYACSKPPVKKPENLLGEDKMIGILVDVHIADAAFNSRRHRDSLVMKSNPANFYYAALQKHNVQDSIFEKSLVYYASQPRRFEKMYRQILNRLTELETTYSGRKETRELDIQKRRE